MNDLARRTVNAPPSERQEAKKKPLFEGPTSTTDSKVADWLSRYHSPSRSSELFCRYLNAKAELVGRFKAQIELKEHHLCSKPPVMVRLEFPTEDNEINQDLNDLVERAGFKLALRKEPINGKIHKAYVITEDEKGHSSDVSKIAETMEKLLRLASEWNDQSREAAEREAMKKDGVWAAYLKVRWSHI